MSDQRAGLTESPNHWWVSSWARTVAPPDGSATTSGVTRDRVWASNPKPRAPTAGTTTPYSPNGNRPNRAVKNCSIAGVAATAGAATLSVVGEYTSRSGTPAGSGSVTRRRSPTTTSARYGAIGASSCQTSVTVCGPVISWTWRPFATASSLAGTVTRTVNVAFSAGLSLTGYHRRAASGSPRVNAVPASVSQPLARPRPGTRPGWGRPP